MSPVIYAEPERPFWGFGDIFLALAAFMAALVGAVTFAKDYLHAPDESGFWTVLEEGVAYLVLFLALKLLFHRYGHPLLESLGWIRGPFGAWTMVLTGLALAGVVLLLQMILRQPDVHTPFEKMLEDPLSRVVIAFFGITAGPFVEELLFRGFIQPVLVSAIGVFPGILLTSAFFGAMHLNQNAFIWQSGVLIMFVGFVLGTIRHISGSTRSSTIAHMAYNSLPFLALLLEGTQTTPK